MSEACGSLGSRGTGPWVISTLTWDSSLGPRAGFQNSLSLAMADTWGPALPPVLLAAWLLPQ